MVYIFFKMELDMKVFGKNDKINGKGIGYINDDEKLIFEYSDGVLIRAYEEQKEN